LFVPGAPAEYEFTEKKSRFIALALPVSSPEEAREAVKALRKEHPASRHVVHAFVLGPAGEIQGMSDDGEPAGTAGKPVLEVLKGREITNLLVAVVRYFGGIKLGTGGLVRAYSQAARGVLEDLPVEEQILRREFRILCPYPLFDGMKKLVERCRGRLTEEEFTHQIRLEGVIPAAFREELEKGITDLSSGQVSVEWGREFL